MKVIIRDIPQEQKIHPDQALIHLNNLMENFRDKYGDRNVVYFEMAINAFQKYYSYELGEIEGCNVCNDTSNDRHYRNQGYKFCPHCGSSLMDNYE